MITHDPSRTPYAPLLAESRAGHYTLPQDLLDAYRAVESVKDAVVRFRGEAGQLSAGALAATLGEQLVSRLADGASDVPGDFLDSLEEAAGAS